MWERQLFLKTLQYEFEVLLALLMKVQVFGMLGHVSWRRVADILEDLLSPCPGSELFKTCPDCAVLDYEAGGIRLLLINRHVVMYQKS
jgi:hypothetical protein